MMPSPRVPIFLIAFALAVLGGGAFAQSNYALMPGDLVQVSVFQEKDLSGSFRVSGDGMINMPLVGVVKVAGSGEAAAAATLRVRLLDGYLVDPQVTVRVVEYAKLTFTVFGPVNNPGAYSVAGSEKIDLLQAIGRAGGFTRLANRRSVIVKRRIGGKVKVYKFDVRAMARDGADSSFLIRDGDVVTISESTF
jgi:polysaccharide export outer membrane protein